MGSWTKVVFGLLSLALAFLPPGRGAAQQDCFSRLPTDRVSLELRGVDVQATLRLLAQQYRINLVVTDDVKESVTLSFHAVPLRAVFQVIIESSALRCIEREGVLRVSTIERLEKEEGIRLKAEETRLKAQLSEAEARIKHAETRSKLAEAEGREIELSQVRARGQIKEEMIRLLYADAEAVAETLRGILGLPRGLGIAPQPGLYAPAPPAFIGGMPGLAPPAPPPAAPAFAPVFGPAPEATAKGLTVEAHKPTNSVFIRYYEADLERIKKLIKEKLDVPLPQVQIAAQMVITSRNALEQLGVQWGGTLVDQRRNARPPTLLGTGFAAPVAPAAVGARAGLPTPQTTGTAVTNFTPGNPSFTLASILPIDPATGLPTGGTLINLPTAFLPTTAVPGMGILFGIIGNQFNLNLALQALKVQGKARSLAEPKIVTVENATAEIARGFEVPFISQTGFGGSQVQFKEALLKLNVTPTVIREGAVTKIRMKVLVENNEPDFTRSVQGNPPLFKRRSTAEVVVQEGERLVISGVVIETGTTTVRQVPLLGDIPLLGWLFKSREISTEGQELIVIVTPTVLPVTSAAKR